MVVVGVATAAAVLFVCLTSSIAYCRILCFDFLVNVNGPEYTHKKASVACPCEEDSKEPSHRGKTFGV